MKCVPLTISYHLYFLCISKVSNMLHHRSMGRVHSKDKNAALYWYTYIFTYIFLAFFFFLFFIKYLLFYHFHFFFWWSIKFPQRNINHSSETGNITVNVCAIGLFQKKKHTGGGVAEDMEFLNKMWKFQGPRKGIYRGDQEKIICGISTSLGYRPWNFKGVQHKFRKFQGWSFILSGISWDKVTNVNFQ